MYRLETIHCKNSPQPVYSYCNFFQNLFFFSSSSYLKTIQEAAEVLTSLPSECRQVLKVRPKQLFLICSIRLTTFRICTHSLVYPFRKQFWGRVAKYCKHDEICNVRFLLFSSYFFEAYTQLNRERLKLETLYDEHEKSSRKHLKPDPPPLKSIEFTKRNRHLHAHQFPHYDHQ